MLLRFGVTLGLIAAASKGSVLPASPSDNSALQQNSPSRQGDESFEFIKSLVPPVTCKDFEGSWNAKLGDYSVSIYAKKNSGMPKDGKRSWGGNGSFSKNTEHEHDHTGFSYVDAGTCVENSDGTVTGVLDRQDQYQGGIHSTATLTLKTPNSAHIDVAYHGSLGMRGRHVGTIKKNPPSTPIFEDLIKDYKDLTLQNQARLREVYDRSVAWELSSDNVKLVVAREEQLIRSCKDEESIRQPGVCPR